MGSAARGLALCSDGRIVEDPGLCRGGVVEHLDPGSRVRLSKRMTLILRHDPWRYGISLDEGGWASLDELVNALRRDFPWVREWHVVGIIIHDPKGRFELRGGRVRARYGHSFRVEVEPFPGEPPEVLYHGTSLESLSSILSRGILPMKRVYVHLTDNISDAVETGRRHGRRVAVLMVSSRCLKRYGLRPRRVGKSVYIVERVPPECITVHRVV
ncbi:MAG: RNA 2'-phosphotransferase [Desulfurococcales archaeon]|nr:RNA 2'-phosphotransferase [Desulfurococcales archaeon]